MSNQNISVTLSSTRRQKPKDDNLVFGKVFTDHMFIMDYSGDKGWHDPRIIPYQPFKLILQQWCSTMGKLYLKD